MVSPRRSAGAPFSGFLQQFYQLKAFFDRPSADSIPKATENTCNSYFALKEQNGAI